MPKKNVYVYQAIEANRLEFVLAQFDSLNDLACWSERSYASIASAIASCEIDTKLNCYYIRVQISKRNLLYHQKMKSLKNKNF